MSSITWTASALRHETRGYAREVWRMVEAQHAVMTMRLVDSLDEQRRLEDIIERHKPPAPLGSSRFHYLLFSPFRYRPQGAGSRFRRAGQVQGVFYAAEAIETCVYEMSYHRHRFFAATVAAARPRNALEMTGFSVLCRTYAMLDLTRPPLSRDRALWVGEDYAPCQALADNAREAAIEALRNESIRHVGGVTVAILSLKAFAARKPRAIQSWRLTLKSDRVIAQREFPPLDLEVALPPPAL